MRWIGFPVLVLCLSMLGAFASATSVPTILVLGDSLSAGYGLKPGEGWVTLLQQRLRRQGYGYRVVNASVSGETTAGALARLPRALALHRPVIVIIELGANDGLRGLPVRDLRANLLALIRKSRATGARVVLVGIHMPPNYGRTYTEQFHASYADLARREKPAFVPFLLKGIATRDELFLEDRLHPNAAAQPRLLDNVWVSLRPLLSR